MATVPTEGQKRALVHLKLDLEEVVNCPVWRLETKLRPPGSVASTLNFCSISTCAADLSVQFSDFHVCLHLCSVHEKQHASHHHPRKFPHPVPLKSQPPFDKYLFYFYLDSLVLSVPHIINLIFFGLIYFLCCGDIWLPLVWGNIALYECTLLHLSIPLVRMLGLFLGLGFYGYLL